MGWVGRLVGYERCGLLGLEEKFGRCWGAKCILHYMNITNTKDLSYIQYRSHVHDSSGFSGGKRWEDGCIQVCVAMTRRSALSEPRTQCCEHRWLSSCFDAASSEVLSLRECREIGKA